MSRGQTAEEATKNILAEQLPKVMQLQETGELHVDSKKPFYDNEY